VKVRKRVISSHQLETLFSPLKSVRAGETFMTFFLLSSSSSFNIDNI